MDRRAACLRAATGLALLALASCAGGGNPGGNPGPPGQRVTLQGLVLDDAGNPAASAQVLLGQSSTQTDAQGRFTYDNLPAGSYNITAQGGEADPIAYATLELADPVETVDLTLGSGSGFRVRRISPALNQQAALLDSTIVMTFNGLLDPSTVTPDDFSVSPDIGPLLINTQASAGVEIRPKKQLPPGQQFAVTFDGQILSADGEPAAQPLRFQFRTMATDTSPPVAVGFMPVEGSTGFPINQGLRIEFNEPLGLDLTGMRVAVEPSTPVNLHASGRTLLVVPATSWQSNTQYSVAISGAIDAAGNAWPVGQTIELDFTTGTQSAAVENAQPEWNRVLNVIAFASNRFGSYDVFTITPDGSGLTQVSSGADDELHPTLSADGALVAWQARGDGGDWDVFVGDFDHPDDARAVTGTGANETEPVFSRTFTRNIFFVSDRLGAPAIHRMGPDGSGAGALDTAFGGAQVNPDPHPLIDNQLLFASSRGSSLDVWSMSVSAIDNSATTLNLTDSLLEDEFEPSWAPDASFYAYIGNRSDTDQLWVADLGSSLQRQVTDFDMPVSSPSVSPFVGDSQCAASLARPGGGSDLVIIDLVGGDIVHNLTAENGD